MRLVLDTNVVMELLHYRDPRSTGLMQAIAAGQVECCTDARCLAELLRVLAYPQFGLDTDAQRALYERHAALVHEIGKIGEAPDDAPCTIELPRCRDQDDQKFMELAARCGADLLVTRDRELLKLARRRARPAPFGIVLPEQAIAAIAAIDAARESPTETRP